MCCIDWLLTAANQHNEKKHHIGSYYTDISRRTVIKTLKICNVKSNPLQAWTGPEGSRKLRLPDFVTTPQDGGKVVRLTHRPPLPPRKYSWYSFMLEAESTLGT